MFWHSHFPGPDSDLLDAGSDHLNFSSIARGGPFSILLQENVFQLESLECKKPGQTKGMLASVPANVPRDCSYLRVYRQVSLISGKVKGHSRDMNTWLVIDWSKQGVYLHASLQEYIKGPQKNKIANTLTLKFVF